MFSPNIFYTREIYGPYPTCVSILCKMIPQGSIGAIFFKIKTMNATHVNYHLAKLKIQTEIIRLCIARSKYIITALAAKQSLRSAIFFIARLPRCVPSANKIKDITDELDNKIYEYKRMISLSIKQIVGNRHDIFIEDFYWFSINDLKSGYILLYPHNNTKIPNHVLFLVRCEDSFDGKIYFPGDIKLFREVNHTLMSVKGLSEKELGIGFNYASKRELERELSTLLSIIKSNKNE